MKKRLSYALGLFALSLGAFSQVSLISPTGDGGFETGNTVAANGWSTAQPTNANRKWYIGAPASFGQTGTNCAFIGNDATTLSTNATARTAHLYRSITLPIGATNIILTFDYKQPTADAPSGTPSDYTSVYLLGSNPVSGTLPGAANRVGGPYPPTATAISAFTSQTITIPNSYATGTPINLVFTFNGDATAPNGAGAVDNVSLVYTAPTCPAPTALSVSGITSTSATFSWTAGGTEPSWDLYYGPAPLTAPTASTVPTASVTATSFTAGSLASNAPYAVYVRANCGGGDLSGWSAVKTFTTLCANSALPVSEGFNASTIPSCWTQQFVVGTNTTPMLFVATATDPTMNPWEGSNFVLWNSFNSPYTAGKETRLISPPLTTTGVPSVDVDFQWFNSRDDDYSTGAYLNEGVTVQYSLDGIAWQDVQFFARHDGSLANGGTQWKFKTLTLPAAVANKPLVFIGFKFHSEYGINCGMDKVNIMATPACSAPLSLVTSTINATNVLFNWAAPSAGTPAAYQWEVRTTGAPGSGSPVSSGSVAVPTTSANATGLSPLTTYSVYVRTDCGAGSYSNWTPQTAFSTPCQPPAAPIATGTTVCGIGSATLTATAASSATVNWYAAATGGQAIATGTTFATPSLTTTTSYYASTATPPSITSGGVITTAGVDSYAADYYGLQFDAYTNFTLVSVDVFPDGAGATADLVLLDNTGTVIQSTSVAIPAGTGTTPYTIPLNFPITSGTGYVLGVTAGPDMFAETAGVSFPYALGASGQITASYDLVFEDSWTTEYMFFYNWKVSAVCETPRSPVTVTVTPAPSFSISAPGPICSGTGVATVSVTSAAGNFSSYIWSPSASLYTDAAATVPYTGGNATVVYVKSNTPGGINVIANANNPATGCAAIANTPVSVSLSPGSPTVTPVAPALCEGSVASFTASALTSSVINLFSENFNGTVGMTVVNNGGNAPTVWTKQADGYTSNFTDPYTFHSPTNSSFMLSNSDAGNTATSITNTELISPVINTVGYSSLTLKFNHIIMHYPPSEGRIEVSTNGGSTWTAIQTYTDDVGTTTGFLPESVSLTTYTNQANFRFKFVFDADWSWFWAIDDVVLQAPVVAGYSWTGSPGGNGLPASAGTAAPGNTVVAIQPNASGVYNYTTTATVGACTASSMMTLTVNPVPTLTVSAPASPVCTGASATLTANGATSYTWNPGNQTGSSIVVSPTANTTYTVSGTAAGCADTETVSVTTQTVPAILASSSSTLLCTGQSATLTANGATSYTWNPGNQTGTSIVVTPGSTTTYTVVGTSGSCNSTPAMVIQNVSTCTGIDEVAAAGINLYPNPNMGTLIVELSNGISTASLELYDALGKLVIKTELSGDSSRVNTSLLGQGVYMYKVYSHNSLVKVGRLIKQ